MSWWWWVGMIGCPCLFQDFAVHGLLKSLLDSSLPKYYSYVQLFKIKKKKVRLVWFPLLHKSNWVQEDFFPPVLFTPFWSWLWQRRGDRLGRGGKTGWDGGWGSSVSSARNSTLPQEWISLLKWCFHLPPGFLDFPCMASPASASFGGFSLHFGVSRLQDSGHYWRQNSDIPSLLNGTCEICRGIYTRGLITLYKWVSAALSRAQSQAPSEGPTAHLEVSFHLCPDVQL